MGRIRGATERVRWQGIRHRQHRSDEATPSGLVTDGARTQAGRRGFRLSSARASRCCAPAARTTRAAASGAGEHVRRRARTAGQRDEHLSGLGPRGHSSSGSGRAGGACGRNGVLLLLRRCTSAMAANRVRADACRRGSTKQKRRAATRRDAMRAPGPPSRYRHGYHGSASHEPRECASREVLEVFPDFNVEVVEVRDLGGGSVLATLRWRGHGAGSGTPVDMLLWMASRIRAEKCVWWRAFGDKADALEAVGLSEQLRRLPLCATSDTAAAMRHGSLASRGWGDPGLSSRAPSRFARRRLPLVAEDPHRVVGARAASRRRPG